MNLIISTGHVVSLLTAFFKKLLFRDDKLQYLIKNLFTMAINYYFLSRDEKSIGCFQLEPSVWDFFPPSDMYCEGRGLNDDLPKDIPDFFTFGSEYIYNYQMPSDPIIHKVIMPKKEWYVHFNYSLIHQQKNLNVATCRNNMLSFLSLELPPLALIPT